MYTLSWKSDKYIALDHKGRYWHMDI